MLLDARRSGKVVVRKAGVGAAGLDELVIAQIVPTCFESILKAVGRQKISWTYSRGTSVPRAIVVTTTDKLPPPKRTHVGAATILWTRVNCFPPVEDGASHSSHAVPTLPTRRGITRSVSRNAAKLLWTRMLTQVPMRGQPSDHSPT